MNTKDLDYILLVLRSKKMMQWAIMHLNDKIVRVNRYNIKQYRKMSK